MPTLNIHLITLSLGTSGKLEQGEVYQPQETCTKVPSNQILKLQNLTRKSLSENLQTTQKQYQCVSEPQPQPSGGKSAHAHTHKEQQQMGREASGTALPRLRLHPFSCSHTLSSKHQFSPHINKYLPCNLKLVFSTGWEMNPCSVSNVSCTNMISYY